MQNLLVSVIVPTYNRVNVLDRTISSVKKQQYRPIELIIVDDASTDETLQYLNEYNFGDINVRIVKNKKNKGIGYSRNIGMSSASGDFIALLDSDDEWIRSDKISAQVDFLRENGAYGFVATAWATTGFTKVSHSAHFVDDQGFRQIALKYYPAHTSTWLFRSSLIQKAGFFWLKRAEDLEYILRLGKYTKMYCLPVVCSSYHRESGGDYLSHVYMNGLYGLYICFLYRKCYPHFYKAIFNRFFRALFKRLNLFIGKNSL